jgi:hypothetical protein
VGWWLLLVLLLLLLLLLLGGENVADDALDAGFAKYVGAGREAAGFVEVLEADWTEPGVFWGIFDLSDVPEEILRGGGRRWWW